MAIFWFFNCACTTHFVKRISPWSGTIFSKISHFKHNLQLEIVKQHNYLRWENKLKSTVGVFIGKIRLKRLNIIVLHKWPNCIFWDVNQFLTLIGSAFCNLHAFSTIRHTNSHNCFNNNKNAVIFVANFWCHAFLAIFKYESKRLAMDRGHLRY